MERAQQIWQPSSPQEETLLSCSGEAPTRKQFNSFLFQSYNQISIFLLLNPMFSNPLVQNMIQQVVQQQMEEFMNNGGPEEMINQVMAMSDEEMMAMIMPFIPEDIQGTVQELAAMSDEEFFQHMMDQMGMNGGLEGMLAGMGDMGNMEVNMADIIAQWEAPFDVYCDCLPTDMEHGNIY